MNKDPADPHKVLEAILVAQSAKEDGYANALKEIKRGRKTSHWIWYIWPCLTQLRPHTSRPRYLLPNMQAAQLYLKNVTLRTRLLEITVEATQHLKKGTDARKLFGGGGDWEKFCETNTFFGLAACLNQDEETLGVCCHALDAAPYNANLHKRTVDLIVDVYGHKEFEILQKKESRTTHQMVRCYQAISASLEDLPKAVEEKLLAEDNDLREEAPRVKTPLSEDGPVDSGG